MRSAIYVDCIHIKDIEGMFARSMSKAMEDPDIVKILNGRKICRLDLLTSGNQRTYHFHTY